MGVELLLDRSARGLVLLAQGPGLVARRDLDLRPPCVEGAEVAGRLLEVRLRSQGLHPPAQLLLDGRVAPAAPLLRFPRLLGARKQRRARFAELSGQLRGQGGEVVVGQPRLAQGDVRVVQDERRRG